MLNYINNLLICVNFDFFTTNYLGMKHTLFTLLLLAFALNSAANFTLPNYKIKTINDSTNNKAQSSQNDNVAPIISVATPKHNDTLYLDSTYTFTINANDSDGTVDSVTLLINNSIHSTDNNAPFTFNYLATKSGWKCVTAIAYDNSGDSTTSSIKKFLVRTIIPDTIKYEAEKALLSGNYVNKVYRKGSSGDTTITRVYANNGKIKFVMKEDADAIILGYGTYQNGKFSSQVNGVDSAQFTIVDVRGYHKAAQTTANIKVAKGDTVTIYPKSGNAYIEPDFIKAYNAKGFARWVNASVPENEDWDFTVTTIPAGYTIRKDTFDWKKFKIVNDSNLVTQYSFDYEVRSSYFILLDSGINSVLYKIGITDVKGKFDSNGVADSAVAAKYVGVNIGDYIYWNGNINTKTAIYDVGRINVNYPNKILIHSKEYEYITIDLGNAQGNNSSEKIVVTNFLGQVEFQKGFSPRNVNAVRITGKYDAVNGYGHRYFKGWDGGYEFRHGTFGLYGNNRWLDEEYGHHINLNTQSSKVELDYIEAGNGGFSGINWKENYANYTVTDSSSVHHCFIHDVGSEGVYIGSTGNAPQQVFKNLTIENNVFLRCGGEGIQIGWQMGGCVVRNNVVHSGLDWKHPFQAYQDGVLQFSTIGGGAKLENNILMGGGEFIGLIELKRNTTPYSIAEDTIHLKNSLIYGVRGGMLTHFLKYGDGTLRDSITHVVYDGNYYKQIGEDYYEVGLLSGVLDSANSSLFDIRTNYNDVVVRNCAYDNTIDALFRTNHRIADSTNNTQREIPYPQFRNYLGLADSFNYLNISRYTDNTKSYQPATIKASVWKAGNIVQHWNSRGETRFYKCIVATSSPTNRPPKDDTNNTCWELLTWLKADSTISFFPPDDVRLDIGSLYDSLGIGVEDVTAPSSFLIQPDKGEGSINKPSEINTQSIETVDKDGSTATVDLKVYPNPSKGIINVKSNTGMSNLQVYDVLGKQYTTKYLSGQHSTHLNLRALSNGIYIIQIQSITGEKITKKVQINKY